MHKQEYDLVFVVLTYRNTKDLSDFIRYTQKVMKSNYKIIVVNSYFDDTTYNEFEKIAKNNGCDFINVENKGYGYGNNQGIEFAKEKYKFRYLIISNPDIEIQQFELEGLEEQEEYILAPTIKTLTGKDQNPYYYSKIELIEWLKYYSYKKNGRAIAYIGIIINKIYRELRLFIDRVLKTKKRRIYASHGSFVIFGKNALCKLGRVYDERMFLFSEENHLARLAFEKNVKTFMIPSIKVLHKEDGSVSLESENLFKYERESFITYYENWKKNHRGK